MPHAPEPVDDRVLEDLRERLTRTRLVPLPKGVGWDRGVDPEYLADLVRTWTLDYDWREHESRLLGYPWHVTANGTRLLHQRTDEADATALVLLHGWPDSFLRFEKVLPLLSDVHVIVPCLPGYPYGRPVDAPGVSHSGIADEIADAVAELGYVRYVVSGGDIGSNVAEHMAAKHPDRVAALHLTDMPYTHIYTVDPAGLSDEEQDYLQRGQQWQYTEGGYAIEQGSKPHTLAVGLGDSPAGLAAWIVEKLHAWSDNGGDVESVWNRDELLTWLPLYWVTGTIGTSFSPYVEESEGVTEPVRVPTGVTMFPHDIVPAPRAFGERFFDVRFWDEEPSGGHFAAWERPDAYLAGVRKTIDLVDG